MQKPKYLDDDLGSLFHKTPFDELKSIDGKVYRQYENRVTKKFKNNNKGYFIKFHGPVGWKEIFKNLFQMKIPVIGAKREYEALNHLTQNNINCPNVKGFGLKGFNPANSSSFLITEELYNTFSLEDFFLQGHHKNLSFTEKKKLIEKVAHLIRSVHESGLNHRDLYLCHIHIKNKTKFDDMDLSLIDLHRAQIRTKVPFRWLIKDLGGFLHSVLQFGLTERDFYRFMMTYLQCTFEELNKNHLKITNKILQRAFKMYLKPQLQNSNFNRLNHKSNNQDFLFFRNDSRNYLLRKDSESKKEEIIKCIESEDYLINSGQVIKNESGHLIVKVKILGDDFFVKKYRIKSFLHGCTRIFKSTRAYNSLKATIWLNAAGIQTARAILICEEKGILGAKNSYFVSESVKGERLDRAISDGQDSVFLASIINSFFKRIKWIRFSHGDAKTSNFFVNKTLIAIDLDISKKSNLDFLYKDKLSRDKKRMLKSIKGYNDIYSKLSKRFRRN